jgi:hypothetical protein
MAETEIVEIGFKGGQVIAVRLTEAKLKELRKALEKPDGFADVETKGGTIAIALSEVSFIRTDPPVQAVGFSG